MASDQQPKAKRSQRATTQPHAHRPGRLHRKPFRHPFQRFNVPTSASLIPADNSTSVTNESGAQHARAFGEISEVARALSRDTAVAAEIRAAAGLPG